MRAAVVCVNYGSHQLLAENLAPGLAQAGLDVVVVDNFSSNQELAQVTALCEQRGWTLVPNPTNAGFGDGVNLGVKAAREQGADVFIALNPDAVAPVEVLTELVRHVRQNPRALVSPVIDKSDGSKYFRGSMLDYSTGRTKGGWGEGDETTRPWLTAACLAFSAEVFDALGGFAGEYFLYWEDVDFARRAARAGFEQVLRDDLVVLHDEGGTQGASNRSQSPTYYYWNTRNRLAFAAGHLGRADLARWMVRTPAESRQILLRGGRRQLLASRKPLWATLRGSRDGLALAARALVTGRGGYEGSAFATAQPRRVLLAHPSSELYGSDRVALETARALQAEGWAVTVALPDEGPLADELRSLGIEVVLVEMPRIAKSALSPRGLVALAGQAARTLPAHLRVIRSSGADLVVGNTIIIPTWSLAARLARRESVVHVHEAEGSASGLVNRVLYAPLALANGLVANSNYTAEVVRASWPLLGRRTQVVHNGVPGPEEVTWPREVLEAPVQLLYVGRLSPRKGTHLAIDALAEVVTRGVDAHLHVVGSVFGGYEWYETQLREQVERLGLGKRVTFVGFESPVWKRIAAADIVLMPSTGDESFGNAAVEATMSARPLVVSDASGMREAAGPFESTRLVTPGDAGAFAEAVISLVQNWGLARSQAMRDAQRAGELFGTDAYRCAVVRALAKR